MSEREVKNLLGDIYDAVTKIINYTKDMSYDDFMQDSKTIDAVVRNFEIIGEALYITVLIVFYICVSDGA